MSVEERSRTDSATAGATAAVPAVRIVGLRKRFGFRDVLRGVDLEVAPREVVALFGANGAGKSTLLRIVATRWRATEGSAEVYGLDVVRRAPEVRRQIGVVSHWNFLRGELSLEENLRFVRELYGLGAEAAARGDELLERFSLARRRRDRVGTFSQGMTKRANIIRSLLHEPKLWLLDEPFSGLDPEGRDLLLDLVEEHRAAGGAVLAVTHQVERGRDFADRCLVMADGRLVAGEGAP